MEETFLYALFDFDISIMFSPNSSAEQRRLPYWDSWDGGSFDGPYDTAQGELDYDPFAFDVATLGICLALEFQVCFSMSNHYWFLIRLAATYGDRSDARAPLR